MCSGSEEGSYLRLIDFLPLNSRLESNKYEICEQAGKKWDAGESASAVFRVSYLRLIDLNTSRWVKSGMPASLHLPFFVFPQTLATATSLNLASYLQCSIEVNHTLFKAHGLVYQSTLGWRVIKKKRRNHTRLYIIQPL